MGCNCGNNYLISCCTEQVLGPIENYYTKYEVDKLLSGITVSGVTEEELQEAIDEAKTEIEAEIPVVPTNVSAFENDVPYLTEHQSLSAYSTTEEMNEAISAATDNLATEDYVNAQISSQTADFVDGEELSSYTYDKATIDSKIASGGTFDPTQYYNKTATDELLNKKLDASAYTPTDLSNYYNKQEVDAEITEATSGKAETSAVTAINASLTAHTANTNIHVTTAEKNTWNNKQNQLSAGRGIDINGSNVISFNLPISAGTGTYALVYNTGSAASGHYSNAEGLSTQANGNYSHAEGDSTRTNGDSSHAEGYETQANGNRSHAEGSVTKANGNRSHAEGHMTQANGEMSHAEGHNTIAEGMFSHAEGYDSKANDQVSHAEGQYTVANGQSSHAEGDSTVANGSSSHAEGWNTVANNSSEHASGYYNVSNTGSSDTDTTLFSVGNGTSDNRHNAFELRRNGDIYIVSGNTDIKLQDYLVKVWKGTKAEFDAITVKDNDTIYLVTN